MVPTSTISKMFDIIRDEDIVSSYSTEQLKEMLCLLQNEDLTRLRDDERSSFVSVFRRYNKTCCQYS